jgi:hypothetical protein
VASFLTLVAAGPIAWLYNTNTPHLKVVASDEPAPQETFTPAAEMESVEDAAAA